MKKSGKGKVIAISIFVFLLAVAIVIACGIGSRDYDTGKWFQQPDVTKWFYSWGKKTDNDNNEDIVLTTYALSADEYAAYGIEPQAISAGVLTATFTPSNTTNKRTNWTFSWAGNDWSKDKNISNYIQFTPGTDYAPECTYSVLRDFGDSIIVECSSRANPSLKASTRFEYMAKFSSIWGNGSLSLDYGEDLDIFYDLYSDDYCWSIEPDSYVATKVSLKLTNDFHKFIIDTYDESWENEDIIYENVTTPIKWDTLFYPTLQELASAYYNETDWTDIFDVSVSIDCYYNGKVVYSFNDMETIDLTPNAFSLMAIPPTDIMITPNGTVII